MLSISTLILIIFSASITAGEDEITTRFECWSSYNSTGHCVPLADCPHFVKMIQQAFKPFNDDDIKLLRSSKCGEDNRQIEAAKKILVCCPDQFLKYAKAENNEVLPKPGICGAFMNYRLVRGPITELDEYPWTALINYKHTTNRQQFLCGGSLINSRYVVTAGFCVKNRQIPTLWQLHSVRLGEWDQNTNPDCMEFIKGQWDCAPAHLDIMIESFIAHPNYLPESENQFFDIALIRLAKQVSFSDYIRPICLPDSWSLRNKDFTNVTMEVAGWSAAESNVKKMAFVNGIDINQCQREYASRRSIDKLFQMCCANDEDTTAICRADTGGPLMVMENIDNSGDAYFLAGVAAYIPKSCDIGGKPGIYTNVGYFVDWIKSNLIM